MSDWLYYRMAETSVDTRARELDVLAVPYDTPARVMDNRRPEPYTETIAAGAFRHLPIRPNRIPLLRDHDLSRTIGHCRAVHVNRPDGLHATVKVSRTPLGDESLELASDGSLHVSIGFASDAGDDVWTGRAAVVRRRCRLVELSLVPIPAYEGADVLAVRSLAAGLELEPEPALELVAATPRLDQVRAYLASRV